MATRIEIAIELVSRIEGADVSDESAFRDLFRETCALLDIADVDFARHFAVTRTTINRWRNGRAVPGTMARPAVYRFLMRRLRAAILKSKEEEFAARRVDASYGESAGRSSAPPPHVEAMAAKGRD